MASLDEIKNAFLEVFERAKNKSPDTVAINKVFQFVLDDGTEFYIEISNGNVKIESGRHPQAVATLSTDAQTLMQILKGELDAMAAFMRGKLRITGNVIETVKLRQILEAGKA